MSEHSYPDTTQRGTVGAAVPSTQHDLLGYLWRSDESSRSRGQQRRGGQSGQQPQGGQQPGQPEGGQQPGQQRQPQGGQQRQPQGGQQRPSQGGQPPQGPGGQGPGGQGPQGGGDDGISRRALLVGGGVAAIGVIAFLQLNDDGDSSNGGNTDEAAIRAVLQENARTLEQENLDGYMDTIHPESPLYGSTEDRTRQLFQQYDINVEMTIESITVDGETAEAQVAQTTELSSESSGTQSNRRQLTHELRTYQGEWRIYNSRVTGQQG